jgi:lysylphosphatidylglycerol synthetase-like protein (DUF2156 family)
MQRTVRIWENPNTVCVYRKSKSIWIAIGDYIGKHIEVRDQSESAALNRWREAAEYKGNIVAC